MSFLWQTLKKIKLFLNPFHVCLWNFLQSFFLAKIKTKKIFLIENCIQCFGKSQWLVINLPFQYKIIKNNWIKKNVQKTFNMFFVPIKWNFFFVVLLLLLNVLYYTFLIVFFPYIIIYNTAHAPHLTCYFFTIFSDNFSWIHIWFFFWGRYLFYKIIKWQLKNAPAIIANEHGFNLNHIYNVIT